MILVPGCTVKCDLDKQASYTLTLSSDASEQEQKRVVFVVAASSSCICSVLENELWAEAPLC